MSRSPVLTPVLTRALTGGLAAATVLAGVALAPAGTSTATPPAPTAAPAPASAGDALWTPLDEEQAARGRAVLRAVGARRDLRPEAAAAYRLDVTGLADLLRQAPHEATAGPGLLLSVPSPDGELVDFRVTDSPVMQPGLAARHPDIRTFAGTTTADFAPASIRLDLTPLGFHASVRGPAGAAWYVDPAYHAVRGTLGADRMPYLSYRGSALPAETREPDVVERGHASHTAGTGEPARRAGAASVLRTYRLALITDDSYARYVAPGATGAEADRLVTAAKATLVNRLNQVYGDDAGIRMLLVDATDATNLNTAAEMYEPGGPCGPVRCYSTLLRETSCDSEVLDRTVFVAGNVVGAQNYDIGHLGLGLEATGGIAGLGVVGGPGKARGCTSVPTPIGDKYAIDYVAHELGHQFGADHTYGSRVCGGNLVRRTAVEPGSGVTVMGYASICGRDDLQPHSDPYFSQASLTQMDAFVRRAPRTAAPEHRILLSGFGADESFRLRFGDVVTRPIAGGRAFTRDRVAAAIDAALGRPYEVFVTGQDGYSDVDSRGVWMYYGRSGAVPVPVVEPVDGSLSARVQVLVDGGLSGNRGTRTTPGNRAPVVTAPPTRTVPLRTPFRLTGSATDADGDRLAYLWEQNDPSTSRLGAFLTSNDKPGGPLFRVFGEYAAVTTAGSLRYASPGENQAGTSPSRSFPDLRQVVRGHTNAATGRCPRSRSRSPLRPGAVLDCYSEFLPTSARTLHFRLTARDLAGGVATDDVVVRVSRLGPFLVTSQPRATTAAAGGRALVTWTRGMRSLAGRVRITFSADGGRTFPYVLARRTANDGRATLRWPDVATGRGRVRVEALDNYFYAVNGAPVRLTR